MNQSNSGNRFLWLIQSQGAGHFCSNCGPPAAYQHTRPSAAAGAVSCAMWDESCTIRAAAAAAYLRGACVNSSPSTGVAVFAEVSARLAGGQLQEFVPLSLPLLLGVHQARLHKHTHTHGNSDKHVQMLTHTVSIIIQCHYFHVQGYLLQLGASVVVSDHSRFTVNHNWIEETQSTCRKQQWGRHSVLDDWATRTPWVFLKHVHLDYFFAWAIFGDTIFPNRLTNTLIHEYQERKCSGFDSISSTAINAHYCKISTYQQKFQVTHRTLSLAHMDLTTCH